MSNQYSQNPDGPNHGSDDSGPYWCCVIDTPYGRLPGKATANRVAWYSYGGEEYEQHENFMYIIGH